MAAQNLNRESDVAQNIGRNGPHKNNILSKQNRNCVDVLAEHNNIEHNQPGSFFSIFKTPMVLKRVKKKRLIDR